MAKSPQPSKSLPNPLPAIDPDAPYRVKLSRAVRLGKNGDTVLLPKSDNVVKGKVIADLGDAVTSYEPA